MTELWQKLNSNQFLVVLIPIGVAVIVAGLCLVLWKYLYKWLLSRAERFRSESLNMGIRSISKTALVLCFVIGIYAGVRASELPASWTSIADKILVSLLILAAALVMSSIASISVAVYTRKSKLAIPMTSLVQNAARVIILVLGALIILDTLGVKITSLIAALGIGSLAIALALQETLSNLFAGIYVVIGGKIKSGDYIKLDSGEEGFVVDIGWRSTTIKPFQNTIIIIPNSKLSQSIVTNYNLPDPWIQIAIPINVSYETDIDKLEEILLEEGRRAIKEIPGMLIDFEPVVRFSPGFGDFSLNFVFVFRVRQFVDQYFVQHELRKRILKRFRKEGIEIPFPIHTININSKTQSTGEGN
ncbi:MAG: mechanosensitive ion channel family protein [Dehalococcoidales bacterium]|nr:mechanosensitive ion channel family protein [Dehalococcoidales bacterium]